MIAADMLAPPRHPIEHLPEEWETCMRAWDQPRYRGRQIFRWIHQRGVLDPAQMSDLPKALRERLVEAGLAAPLDLAEDRCSQDGTRKLVLALGDGRRIESVLIPRGAPGDLQAEDGDDAAHADALAGQLTQCVSSQVGCAMGCAFCASGIAGLKRHLSAAEIVGQVLAGRGQLGEGQRLSGLVYMGMGEPLHNYAALARSLVLLSHPDGVGLSLKRVTVSTSGLVPQIEQLARDFGGRVQLAISLHAVDDDTRSRLMPINRKHGLDSLLEALGRYPLLKRQRITIEYTLIRGINDSPAQAARLAKRIGGLKARVNLIPMNPVPDSGLQAPQIAAVRAFQEVLRARGVVTLVRQRKGDDIAAACGQLALQGERRRVRVLAPRA